MNYARILEGPNPGIDALDTESELDMQWAHVGAPGASIDFYLGSDLIDDITGAIKDNACGAISVSHTFYGVASSFIMNVMDPLFQ
jgi:subtilase family serine protease